MKRTLILATFAYLLYDRQRRVERRQLAWKQGVELGMLGYIRDTNEAFTAFADGYHDWAEHLTKETIRVLKEGAL